MTEKEEGKNIIKMSSKEARNFFLKNSSYCSFNLPTYFQFESLLKKILKLTNSSDYNPEDFVCAKEYEDVNYKLLKNKSGGFSWRPLELINPILYGALVKEITKDKNWKKLKTYFNKKIESSDNISFYSLPVESTTKKTDKSSMVIKWWREVEQRSIKQILDYDYMLKTDIKNCYPSIYTHEIARALHGKQTAKDNRGDYSFLGVFIDSGVRCMSYGESNGIPQGSELMNFIAEIVLCNIDSKLSERLENKKIENYSIIRYRDDYRIFSNKIYDLKIIAKELSDVLSDFNFNLSDEKTFRCEDLISGSIKPDKVYFKLNNKEFKTLQEKLLFYKRVNDKFNNCGALIKPLNNLNKKVSEMTSLEYDDPEVLISIVVDIAYKSPRFYPNAIAVISNLLKIINSEEKQKKIIKKIQKKFKRIPNTAFLSVWLQRIAIKYDLDLSYPEKLCEVVSEKRNLTDVWNSGWLKNESPFKEVLENSSIVDSKERGELPKGISNEEIDIFEY